MLPLPPLSLLYLFYLSLLFTCLLAYLCEGRSVCWSVILLACDAFVKNGKSKFFQQMQHRKGIFLDALLYLYKAHKANDASS